MKESHSPIAMITAYDAPSGRLADAAGADMILVGDSAAMTVLGHDSTVPGDDGGDARADARGDARRAAAAVVADMPFGSFQISDELAVTNAVRFVKEQVPTPSSSRAPGRCSPACTRSSAPASR